MAHSSIIFLVMTQSSSVIIIRCDVFLINVNKNGNSSRLKFISCVAVYALVLSILLSDFVNEGITGLMIYVGTNGSLID